MFDQTRNEDAGRSSERNFGLVFTGIFMLLAIWPLLFSGGSLRLGWLLAAVASLFAAFLRPTLLVMPNIIWYRFGLLLHSLMSPLILLVLYFLFVVPSGVLMRLAGWDPMKLRFDRRAESYWVRRESGPEPESLTNQF